MPLKKLTLRPGVNQENTRYTSENGWYTSQWVRFRQGTPEKIGGWYRTSATFFQGICRSLWAWVSLNGANLIGVGTNLKFYIYQFGVYNDVTPIRSTNLLGTDPFTGDGTTTVVVSAPSHGANNGDFVTFSGATGTYASTWNQEYQIAYIDANSYSITVASAIPVGAYGGSAVSAQYQVHVGTDIAIPQVGWGAGGWGAGTWGYGVTSNTQLRLWSQANFGENLVFGYRGGPIYYWVFSSGTTTRAIDASSLLGASDIPTIQNYLLVSDTSRFVFAFGCNDYGGSDQNLMLIRWSDQESITQWTPAPTNQAGSIQLSHGSQIVTAMQARQEILVWTDSSLYSMQYVGPPIVWGSQLVGDNISVVSPNATAYANGVAYWMGVDKFYMYNGRTQTLRCDLRQFIFGNINRNQFDQVFAGTNEGFNEIWWFYCTADSDVVNRYVVYNYIENNGEGAWYYGDLGRTAWMDSGLEDYPIAATYEKNMVYHEYGVDNNTTDVTLPIESWITSAEFDIDDGYHVGFVWRMLPDVTFRGSSAENPSIRMYLKPLQNAGSGINEPESLGGQSNYPVTRTAVVPIEEFTGQVNIRVRGRQLIVEARSEGDSALGVQWQLGSPRIDIRPDGRR